MMRSLLLLLAIVAIFATVKSMPSGCEDTCSALDFEARVFIERESELLRQRRRQDFIAAYNYNINVTEANRQTMINVATANAVLNKELAPELQKYLDKIDDEDLLRQARILSNVGFDALSEKDYKELKNAITAMQSNYATTTVCSFFNKSDCSLTLEPHIQERLSNSRDPEELKHYWKEWYDKAGTPMRKNFTKYVQLSSKAAHLNNFMSYADYWLHFYEDNEFEENLDAAYKAILPLYRAIHAYVRHRLNEHYGNVTVPDNGNIPMHLLGNMWAQNWDEAMELYTPYPEVPFLDVTSEMEKQNYTVEKMFQLGDEFFKSLNMRPLPESFWNLSVLKRPTDRPIVCHASAWDMLQDSDVRIKMCTEVDTHYLYVVHHELGHIQYYLQYENQPVAYRSSANPGFHEAVGDVIALSVSTPKHLKTIGLSPTGQLDAKRRINELFKTALKKVVFLPFAYTLDKYRYSVFRDEIDESTWNCAFWRMRSMFTGVEPPVVRTDRDFDPPAKYHIDADVEYLRYFAAHIFQFQFYKALCTLSKQYVPNDINRPLDNCDFFNNKAAGRAFSKFLTVGNSKHWKPVLEEFTGDDEMNPAALLEYFAPLYEWLKTENKRLGAIVGWEHTDKVAPDCCPPFST
ncbi:angiotensin-converting enzyme-related protein [Teleopsis dalmanni]|uniref:angiotensin-converting enzyme-related protein n=1 Tax=Teleopsis dalmanni TaxID=139649 RepID=UPI0018CCF1FE|nr:angiotensin-converting enzyme-related protein [Teleopsis dalmanni]XP_037927249.1 angiotensin-converting enzyme-related protein [Teleopsis dalmanni]